MNRRLVSTALFLAAGLFSLCGFAEETPDPITAVKTATDDLLSKLDDVRPLYDSDREKFYTEIESALGPFIDFDGFARGVMAKYYRLASDEQKEQFSRTFQNQLIRTYSSALVEFKNEKIEVLPLEEPPEGGRATARLEIHGEGGEVYPVTYTLAMVDGSWKLRNIIVEGINIGLQFRSQFSNYMQKYRNDIDQVIQNWDVDIQSS